MTGPLTEQEWTALASVVVTPVTDPRNGQPVPQPTFVRLWRCTMCGKWSHARRKPKHHQGFVPESVADMNSLPILDYVPAEYDHEGEGREAAIIVACGPFEDWIAIPLDTESSTR